MSTLNANDRRLLQRQIEELEQKIEEEKITNQNLINKVNTLREDDAFYRRQWNFFNNIIFNYEQEIKLMSGQFIINPITETDIEEHARENGRLYAPLEGTNPRTIAQFHGSPLGQETFYEGMILPSLAKIINDLRNGETPTSGSTSQLRGSYSPGSEFFDIQSAISSNAWYLLGGNCLLRVGSVESITEGSGPSSITFWRAHISERYFREGLDRPASNNDMVQAWNGFSDSERISEVAASTTQGFFDAFKEIYLKELQFLFPFLSGQAGRLRRNQDFNLNQNDKDFTLNTEELFQNHIDNLILSDEVLDIIDQRINERAIFIPERIERAREDMGVYFTDRIGFTRLRCNTSNGSLSRLIFLEELLQDFQPNGNPDTIRRLRRLKAILAQN